MVSPGCADSDAFLILAKASCWDSPLFKSLPSTVTKNVLPILLPAPTETTLVAIPTPSVS